MNDSLAMAECAYVPQRKRKSKKKKQPRKNKQQLSRTGLKEVSPKHVTQPAGRAASKSVEPHKLPVVKGSSPRQMSPSSQHVTSSMDLSMERLEKLQSKNTSARNEWLAVQERILALGLRNKCLLDVSVDEARDLFIDNHYEVLLHKWKNNSKTPLRLPPIRRPVD